MIRIIDENKHEVIDGLFTRLNESNDVKDIVADIIEEVKRNGDSALLAYAEKFDRAYLDSLIVSEEEIEEGIKDVDLAFLNVLEEAKNNIYAYHLTQKKVSYELSTKPGVKVGMKVVPIEKVGIYVPGGTANYPSTVLMDSIPAKIAGVKKIIISTPPNSEGKINPNILAAAKVAGIDTIIKSGGAQAIAALAYGTESIERVDKIVGPGNAYVQEAKKQVYGKVDIDMTAGPTEILIISDDNSNPTFVASDMLSQCEHDVLSRATLICLSNDFATKVALEIDRQVKLLDRYDIANESIETQGKIIIVNNLDEAIELSNKIAPEHLELCVDEPKKLFKKVENAGGVFLGRYTPESIGDYFAGPNHTLPTMGCARYSSALGVDDFVKKIEYTEYNEEALKEDYKKVALFARKEGFTAHARAVEIRFENDKG